MTGQSTIGNISFSSGRDNADVTIAGNDATVGDRTRGDTTEVTTAVTVSVDTLMDMMEEKHAELQELLAQMQRMPDAERRRIAPRLKTVVDGMKAFVIDAGTNVVGKVAVHLLTGNL